MICTILFNFVKYVFCIVTFVYSYCYVYVFCVCCVTVLFYESFVCKWVSAQLQLIYRIMYQQRHNLRM